MLRIKDLHKSFGALQVLNGIDIVLNQGMVCALLGPNGVGKTTLIKCILGLNTADKGAIILFGTDTRGRNDYRKRQMICVNL